VSRRRERRADPAAGGQAPRGVPSRATGRDARRAGPSPAGGRDAPRDEPPTAMRGLARDLVILIAVFAAAAGIAELAGAANLGVALGVGQVAFAIALVVLLTRR
jgi:hypothetical protein